MNIEDAQKAMNDSGALDAAKYVSEISPEVLSAAQNRFSLFPSINNVKTIELGNAINSGALNATKYVSEISPEVLSATQNSFSIFPSINNVKTIELGNAINTLYQEQGLAAVFNNYKESGVSGIFSLNERFPFGAYSVSYANLFSNLPEDKKEYCSNDEEKTITTLNQEKDKEGLQELFGSISEDEANEFVQDLYKYPLLGFHYSIGNRIYDELKKKLSSELKTITKTTLYRVRAWDESNRDYGEREMFEPPYGIDKTNRFSCLGLNFLYMADSIQTALQEVKEDNTGKTGIKVVLSSAKIWDISSKTNIIFELCNRKNSKNSISEYILPSFLAQCCILVCDEMKIQIDGIKYKSLLNPNSISYVFFKFGYSNFQIEHLYLNKELTQV